MERRKDKITSRPPTSSKFQITVACQVKKGEVPCNKLILGCLEFPIRLIAFFFPAVPDPKGNRPYPPLPFIFCCDFTYRSDIGHHNSV